MATYPHDDLNPSERKYQQDFNGASENQAGLKSLEQNAGEKKSQGLTSGLKNLKDKENEQPGFAYHHGGKTKVGSELADAKKTATEGAKLAADISDGNYLDAARNVWKNKGLYLKQSKKLVAVSIIGFVAGVGILFLLFYGLFTATGGALKSIVTAFEKIPGVSFALEAGHEVGRIASALTGGLVYNGSNQTQLGQELASLNLNQSFEQLAILGNNSTRGSPDASSQNIFAQILHFADIKSSAQGLNLSQSAQNLGSSVSIENGSININGTSVSLPPANASPQQLQNYYNQVTNVLNVSDPFKFYASIPQLQSFQQTIKSTYQTPTEAWPDRGIDYQNLSDQQAFQKVQDYTHQVVTSGSNSSGGSSLETNLKFYDSLKQQVQQNLQQAISNGSQDPANVAENDAVNQVLINKVLTQNLSSTMLAGYSACLVHGLADNGIRTSSVTTMVPNSIRQAVAFANAADQTVAGDLNGNELGANLQLYGDVYNQANYQYAIYTNDWNNPGYVQMPITQYQELQGLLDQAPPTNFLQQLEDFVLNKVMEIYGPWIIGYRPGADFINKGKCGSTDQLSSSVSYEQNAGWWNGAIAYITGGEGQVHNRLDQLSDLMNSSITNDSAFDSSALALIPHDSNLNSKSGVNLGFAFLLKTALASSLGYNYSGYSNPNYGNQVGSGFSLLNNEESRMMGYGRPLTLGEVNDVKSQQLSYHQQQLDHMSIFAKLFSASNPYSLTSHIAVAGLSLKTNFFDNMMSAISHGLAMVSQPASLFGSVGKIAMSPSLSTSQLAFADSGDKPNSFVSGQYPDSNFGNIQWGWSPAEINKIDSDSSYSVLNNASLVEGWLNNQSSPQYNYIQNIGKCFGNDVSTITTDSNQLQVCADMNGNQLQNGVSIAGQPAGCTMSPADCADTALRYRLYESDKLMISDLKDLQTVTDDSSSTSSSTTTPAIGNTADVPCATGTQDAGTADGYSNGQKYNIRLCALPDVHSTGSDDQPSGLAHVNSTASGQFEQLVEAAKAAGITLSANSSFRTMALQQQLFAADPNPALVAQPGYSNHQMGFAIDFTMANSAKFNDSSGTCVNVGGRCEAPGDQVWEWLNNNATNYGIKPYSAEYWHWSTTGN